jgi:pimeloyl-ACP methyl ester carboxylesterase
VIGAAIDRLWFRGSIREGPLGAGRIVALPSGGAPLRAWRGGEAGPAPTVVVVPDPPNVIEHHLPQLEAIGRDTAALGLELPGFGHSAVPRAFDFSLQGYAEVLAAVLERESEGPLVLAFSCIGGLVAIELAARMPRVVGLLLVQTPSLEDAQSWARRVDPAGLIGTPVLGQLLVRAGRRRIADRWYRAALPRGAAPEPFVRPALAADDAGADYCLASALQALRGVEAPTAEVPATVLWGCADRTHRPSDPERLRASLPRLQVRTVADAGHFPDLEAPEDFALELRRLFDRLGD